MKTEKNFKLLLIVILLIAMLMYHFLGLIPSVKFNNFFGISDGCSSIYTIARILATILAILFTLSIPIVSRILNLTNYLGGHYKGRIFDPNNAATLNDQINITLIQNLLSIRLTGVTFKPIPNQQGEFRTEYVLIGHIVDKESDLIKFIIEIEGQALRTYGLLTLRFEENLGIGYFYETGQGQNIVREVQIKKIENRIIKWIKSLF